MGKWLKKNGLTIGLAVIAILGLCLLLYPSFSDWWNSMRQSQAIAAYTQLVENLSPEEVEERLNAAREYNNRLWDKENRWFLSPEELEEYNSLLDVTGTGIMGVVNIPLAGISLPIYHGTDEEILQIASGHIPGTSLPVGGEGVHAAVSGHRGLPSARLFTDLDKLAEGDIFTITVLNQMFTYQIEEINVVLPEDISKLALEEGGDLCTLQTCTPYGVNSHRMLLKGRRIDNLQGDSMMAAIEVVRVPHYLVVPVIGVPLLLLIMIIALIHSRRKRRKPTAEDLKKKNIPKR